MGCKVPNVHQWDQITVTTQDIVERHESTTVVCDHSASLTKDARIIWDNMGARMMQDAAVIFLCGVA
jgi:hypothetical protein